MAAPSEYYEFKFCMMDHKCVTPASQIVLRLIYRYRRFVDKFK